MIERSRLDGLCMDMIAYDAGSPHRIQHFLKVSALAALIGRGEGLDEHTVELLEAAGYVHDIGIRLADERYGSHPGKLQEELGPAEARPMLERRGFSPEDTERLCWLIAHHHSYEDIREIDHQILVEADFLVNLHEHQESREAIAKTIEKIFRTATGTRICRKMFLGEA
ncbi:MAG: HD domain-containing protein [Clostridia bacterium]|nr:HD domain-containing protein [Clostridia bacterium]